MQFQYLKFNITGVRDDTLMPPEFEGDAPYLVEYLSASLGAAEFQFTDFNVYNNGLRVDYSNATATWSTTTLFGGDSVKYNGIDGDINTKIGGTIANYGTYANGKTDVSGATYIINFNKLVTATEYSFITGNDSDYRDPVAWTVAVSTDGENYTPVDVEMLATITRSRQTETQMFLFDQATWSSYTGDIGSNIGYGDDGTSSGTGSSGTGTGSSGSGTGSSGSGSGSSGPTLDPSALTMIFQYLRFDITGVRGDQFSVGRSDVQFTDFNVYMNTTRVDYTGATATWSTNELFGDSDVAYGIDGDPNTKFGATVTDYSGYGNGQFNISNSAYTINFNKLITANHYSYVTGFDIPDRDPVSWTISISTDGVNFTPIDSESVAQITTERLVETQFFGFGNGGSTGSGTGSSGTGTGSSGSGSSGSGSGTVICFNEGTKILCLSRDLEEVYVPIERLRKGDFVKSYKHGYRKIDLIGKNTMINNPDKFSECMYKMTKTDSNGLTEDLIVTGGHSIMIDDLGKYKYKMFGVLGQMKKIDDKYLVLASASKDFEKMQNNETYTYYHFVLENNGDDSERYGVYSNGILTETPSKREFVKHGLNLI